MLGSGNGVKVCMQERGDAFICLVKHTVYCPFVITIYFDSPRCKVMMNADAMKVTKNRC